MILGKYSIGVGDRFGRQGRAQLAAVKEAARNGIEVIPVWNKSHREHNIIGTTPDMVRKEADEAAEEMGWRDDYYCDADHISLKNVDLFMNACDFYTLDVSDCIGEKAQQEDIENFVAACKGYSGGVSIQWAGEDFVTGEELIRAIGEKYLAAIKQAGKIYRHIMAKKGMGNFIAELSLDEGQEPQTPIELFFILAAVSQEEMLIQTVAPKFSGRFNKGIDYEGDVEKFEKEFEKDLAVIKFAAEEFGLPKNLKLSVHSGSDKFSIYRGMNKAIKKFGSGLHLKTAGTTWLEEAAGLAMAGGEWLNMAKRIYKEAYDRIDEMEAPYLTVVNIDRRKLPEPMVVDEWDSKKYVETLRHDQNCGRYNPHFRQLIHIAYKVAAEMGTKFTKAIEDCERVIGPNVTENLYQRHIKPIFID